MLAGNGLFSFGVELLRDSHEKGIVSFREAVGLGGGVGDALMGFVEGGPHGMVGNEPDKPGLEGGLGAADAGSCPVLLFEVIVVDRDLPDSEASFSPNWTSSNDAVEIRCAVSNGDFPLVDDPSPFNVVPVVCSRSASLILLSKSTPFERGDWSEGAVTLEGRGVS